MTLDDLLWATAFQIASMLKVHVVLLLPEDGHDRGARPAIRRRTCSTTPIWRPRNGAGSTTSPPAAAPIRCPARKRLFLPMRTGRGAVGVVGLDRDRAGPLLTPDQRRLLDALADQAALAIERVNLAAGHRPRAAAGRDRAAARGAADLDLARSAHAAGLDPRVGDQPARRYRQAFDDDDAGASCSARSRRKPSG